MKKSYWKNRWIYILGFMVLFSIIGIIIVSGNNPVFLFDLLNLKTEIQSQGTLGSISTLTNQKWINTKCTEKECSDYNIEITDAKKQSTIICLTSKDTSPKASTIAIYDSKGLKITDVAKTTALSKDKYCYDTKVNKETYLAFEKTNVVEYKNETRLKYEGASKINITLYKFNGKEYVINPENIFITNNKDNIKFGAVDKDNLGIEQYKYELTGNSFQIDKEKVYTTDIKNTWVGDQYENVPTYTYYDFKDVCSKDKSSCIFNQTENGLEVYFNSDANIDPTITVTSVVVSGSSWLNKVRRDGNFTHLEANYITEPYKNLTMYLPFDMDNNVTAYDFSNNDADGSYGRGTFTSAGLYEQGMYFNSSGLATFSSTALDLTDNLTISVWVNPKTSGGIIFSNRYRYNTNEYGYILSFNNTGGLVFATGNNSNENEDSQAHSSYLISTNSWTHVAVTRAGNLTSFYLNGALTNTKQTSIKQISYLGTITTRYLSYCDDSLTGGTTYKFSDTRFYNGTMDEFMIFNSSLSATDIASIYANNSARYYSTGNQTLPSQNISAGYNRINLTVNFNSLFGSSVSGRIGFWENVNGYNETRYTDILAHWTGDNNANSTNGNYNGTLIGGATYGTGVYNSSFVFGGDGDYVNLTTPSDILVPNWTISIWTKINKKAGVGNYTALFSYVQDVGGGTWLGDILYTDGVNYGYFDYGANSLVNSPSGINISDGNWHNLVYVQSFTGSVTGTCYVDGVYASCNEVGTHSAVTPSIMSMGGSPIKHWAICGENPCIEDLNGGIDDLIIINRSLTNAEAQRLYIKGLAKYNYTAYQTLTSGVNSTFNVTTTTTRIIPDLKLDAGTNNFYSPIVYGSVLIDYFNVTEAGGDTTKPNVTFNYQVPTDLNLTNFIGVTGVNITYNISDETTLNLTTVKLYYKSNSTVSNIDYYQNGTGYSGYFSKAYTDNSSHVFNWNLLDNEVLPGVYNYGEITLENTAHSFLSLANANTGALVEFYNVSNTTQYSFVEIMLNKSTTGGAGSQIYYCNSSFPFNGQMLTDVNCINFYTVTARTTYDHTHTIYSSHQVAPMAIVNGKVGTVVVTSRSSIGIRGSSGGVWNIGYITNTTRESATKTSASLSGGAWTNQTYTIDAHIHQFETTTALWYYACANDTAGNQNCSSERQDLLTYGGLPPDVFVYTPTENIYSGFINITYKAESPNAYDIVNYTIELLNSTYDFNATLVTNTTNTDYNWNSSTVPDGEYVIRVWATDNISQMGFGLSQNFTINNTGLVDNSPPYFTTIAANATLVYGTGLNVTFNATDALSLPVYYFINDTTYFQINQSGTLTNKTILAVGTYLINVSVNDTRGNVNWTMYQVDVTGATPTLTRLLNGIANNLTVVYPQQVNATGYTTGGIINITRDGIEIVNGANYTLGVGYYRFDYNVTGGQNYTNVSQTLWANVTKATSVLTFLANGGTSNLTLTYPQQVNITAIASAGTVGLDKDNVDYLANNGLNVTLGVGSYIFRANITGNENYTDVGYSYYNITITQASSTGTLLLNDTADNITGSYPMQVNVSFTNTSSATLYKDGVDITTLNNVYQNLGVGYYNFTLIIPSSENYSGFTLTRYVNISKATSQTSLIFDKTSPQVVGAEINASCSKISGEGNVILYRNGTDVTATENNILTTLGIGTYTYECNLSSSQNYTASTNVSVFIIQDKSPGQVYLLLNDTAGDITFAYGNQVNASASSNIGQTIILYRDGVDVTLENNIYKTLGIGYYNYTAITTANATHYSASITRYLNITKSQDGCDIMFNETSPLVYPGKFLVYTNCTSDFTIYRNGTIVGNNSEQSLAAGLYNFTVIRNDTQNYTYTSSQFDFQITPANSVVYTYLNNSRANLTIYQPTSLDLNSTLITGEGIIKLYKDNTLINSGTSPLNNLTPFNNPGMYNITTIYEATENYTSSYETWWLNVTDNQAPNATLLTPVNGTLSNSSSQNLTVNISDNFGIKNATLYVYNQSGFYNSTTTTFPANTLTSTLGIVINLVENVYNWFYQIFDWSGNTYTTGNNTISIDTTIPNITIYELSPNPAEFSADYIIFNWTVTDLHLDSYYFNLTNSSGAYLLSNNQTKYINFSNTFFEVDLYTFIIWANDTHGNVAQTSPTLLVLNISDTTPPSVVITDPLNNTIFVTSFINITLNITVNDSSPISTNWYSLDNGLTNTTFLTNQTWISFPQQEDTTKSYTILACSKDIYNNYACNSTSITITIPNSGTGGGSSGGGGTSSSSGCDTMCRDQYFFDGGYNFGCQNLWPVEEAKKTCCCYFKTKQNVTQPVITPETIKERAFNFLDILKENLLITVILISLLFYGVGLYINGLAFGKQDKENQGAKAFPIITIFIVLIVIAFFLFIMYYDSISQYKFFNLIKENLLLILVLISLLIYVLTLWISKLKTGGKKWQERNWSYQQDTSKS